MGASSKKYPRKVLEPIALKLIETSKQFCRKSDLCGSFRRNKELVSDIDLIILGCTDVLSMLEEAIGPVTIELCNGSNFRTRYLTEDNVPIDVWNVPDEKSYGCAKFYATGSGPFNVLMRRVAVYKGMSLLFNGLTRKSDGVLLSDETEESVFRHLGIDFVEPMYRDPFDPRYDSLVEELDRVGV